MLTDEELDAIGARSGHLCDSLSHNRDISALVAEVRSLRAALAALVPRFVRLQPEYRQIFAHDATSDVDIDAARAALNPVSGKEGGRP